MVKMMAQEGGSTVSLCQWPLSYCTWQCIHNMTMRLLLSNSTNTQHRYAGLSHQHTCVAYNNFGRHLHHVLRRPLPHHVLASHYPVFLYTPRHVEKVALAVILPFYALEKHKTHNSTVISTAIRGDLNYNQGLVLSNHIKQLMKTMWLKRSTNNRSF